MGAAQVALHRSVQKLLLPSFPAPLWPTMPTTSPCFAYYYHILLRLSSNYAHHLAPLHLEGDILQSPDVVIVGTFARLNVRTLEYRADATEGGIHRIGQGIAQGLVALSWADAILFAQILNSDCNVGHGLTFGLLLAISLLTLHLPLNIVLGCQMVLHRFENTVGFL
jgi:hypothetical protein